MLNIAICGAAGRMGKRLAALAHNGQLSLGQIDVTDVDADRLGHAQKAISCWAVVLRSLLTQSATSSKSFPAALVTPT